MQHAACPERLVMNGGGGKMGLIQLYIEKMLIHMLVAIPFYVVGRLIFIKNKQVEVKLMRELMMAGFTVYMIALASQTIIPQWEMGIASDTGKFYFEVHRVNQSAGVNLIPLHTIFDYAFHTNAEVMDWGMVSLLNLAGNVFLFSPIGFFLPFIWKRWQSFRKILWVGLGTTCFIEFVQFFIGRSSDIDDVLLNTIGVLIGYWAYYLFCRKISPR